MKNLVNIINDVPIVFFDVFDTLIQRAVSTPEEIFDLVEKRYNQIHGEKSEFATKRRIAEKRARKRYSYTEVNFDEIYGELLSDFNAEQCNEFYEMEIQAEIDFCFPIKEMCQVFQYAKNMEKQIYIVTDMYLPALAIKKILSKNKIVGYEKIYVSGEYHKTKRSGKLFSSVIRELKISAEDVLHIGNDKVADYRQPLKLGMQAYLFQRIIRKCWQPYDYTLNLQNTDKMEVALLKKFIRIHLSEENDNEDFQLGYSVFGPLLMGYSKWLFEQCAKKQIDTLLFCARDGYVLKQCFDLVNESNIHSEYFYISRRAVVVPNLYRNSSILDMIRRYKSWPKKVTVSFLLQKMGINLKNKNSRKQIMNKQFSIAEFKKNIRLQNEVTLFYEEIRNASYIQAGYLKEYIKQISTAGEKIALIDCGGNRTIESNLRDFCCHEHIDLSFYGLYLEMTGKSTEFSDAYLFSQSHDSNLDGIINPFYYFLEIILSAPHGTVEAYKKIDNQIYPVFGHYDYSSDSESQKMIRALQKGAIQFICDFKSLIDYVNLSPYTCIQFLFNFGMIPKRRFVERWGNFKFNADCLQKVIVYDESKTKIFNMRRAKQQYKASLWKSGYVSKILETSLFNPLIFKVKNKYLKKRKR